MAEGYQRLTIDEVLVDLPSLDLAQLRFVMSLEEAAGPRGPVLDRIDELLVAGEPAALGDDVRPARPRRRRARPAGILVAVVACAVVIGGAVLYQARGSQAVDLRATIFPATEQVVPTWPAKAGPTPTNRITGQTLDRLVVADLPAGYTRVPNAAPDTASSELQSALADDGAPGAASSLTKAGFLHFYERAWQSGDEHQLVVSIYQFNDPAGAATYGRRRVGNERSNRQARISGFPVGGVPGGVGLTSASGDTVTATVYFAKASYFVRLSVNWYTASGLEGTAQQVARSQYGRL